MECGGQSLEVVLISAAAVGRRRTSRTRRIYHLWKQAPVPTVILRSSVDTTRI
jgi:hypothetical protein